MPRHRDLSITTYPIQQRILDLLVQGHRSGEIKEVLINEYNIAPRTCDTHMKAVREELAKTSEDGEYWTNLVTEMYKKLINDANTIESKKDQVEQKRKIADSIARLRTNTRDNVKNQYNIAVLIPEQRAKEVFTQAFGKPDNIIDIEQE